MSQSGRPVVVGVFSGQHPLVVATAAEYARRFDAELVCAHVDAGRYVLTEHPDGSIVSISTDPEYPDERAEQVDPDLAAWLHEQLDTAGVAWSCRALAGSFVDALGHLAETIDAAMIVVGTRQPGVAGSLREFFNGSVAAHLVHRQSRPVVVVPLSPVKNEASLPWRDTEPRPA